MTDLPPLDQPQAYVVVGPNDQRGPYTMELLISEVLAGRLSEATPVWWPGLADWTTMGAHQGVADELARRRAAAATPAWAEPAAPAADPYAQPAAAPAADVSRCRPVRSRPWIRTRSRPLLQWRRPSRRRRRSRHRRRPRPAPPVADPFSPASAAPAEDDSDVVDAEVIEVEEIVVVDPAHEQALHRTRGSEHDARRAQSRVDAVNEG